MQGKNKKQLTASISGQVENAIADYILESRPHTNVANVFVRHNAPNIELQSDSLGMVVNIQCKRAGIEKKSGRSFHALRRTFATLLANEGVDVAKIAQMLGQVSPGSSKVYMSFDDREISRCAIDFSDIPIRGGVYFELNKTP